MPACVNTHTQNIHAWMQLSIGRWDKNKAGGSDMNFQGPISQRHFLYVGYTYLEWRLTPLGLNTPHTAAAQLMKHTAYFIGHMLFIYIYNPRSFVSLSSTFLPFPFLLHSTFLFLYFLFCPFFFSGGKGSRSIPIFLHISSYYKILFNVFALQHL